jgi:Rrf2 family transcriptional regulator, nitric oxide-sensitive transcriptional repressor
MLSQTAEYALRAAVFLGEHDGTPTTASRIAKAIHVPGGYLSKVLQALVRAGIVQSQRGLGGGFMLNRKPEAITVLDIIRVVDPFRRVQSCPLELPEHAEKLCPLHQRLDDAMALIEETFGKSTLADLLAESHVPPRTCNGACNGGCGDRIAAHGNFGRRAHAPTEDCSKSDSRSAAGPPPPRPPLSPFDDQ